MKLKISILLFIVISFATFQLAYSQCVNWSWADNYGINYGETPQDIISDADGNIYVTGEFSGDSMRFGNTLLINSYPGFDDIFLAKFDSAGNVLWAKSAGGDYSDLANKLALDDSGNVYVCGHSTGDTSVFGSNILTYVNGGWYKIFLAKYDPAGNSVWVRGGFGQGFNDANSISIDKSGNIYVTGYFRSDTVDFDGVELVNNSGPSGYGDIFLAKYDLNGNLVWAKNFGDYNYEYATDVSTDAAGNIYLTGYYISDSVNFDSYTIFHNDPGTFTYDLFVAKIDPNGTAIWANSAGGTKSDVGYAVKADELGNVYVVGSFTSDSLSFGSYTLINSKTSNYEAFVTKYDLNGNVIWADQSYGSGTIESKDIEVVNSNNIYVLGRRSSAVTFDNETIPYATGAFVCKLDSSGNTTYLIGNGGNNSQDNASAISIYNSNNIYITGTLRSTSFSFDTITLGTNGGTDVYVASYSEAVPPVAGFTFSDSVLTFSFVNTSTCETNWYWDFGDVSQDSVSDPVHAFADTGSYNVCLWVSNDYGTDSICKNIDLSNCIETNFKYQVFGDSTKTVAFFDDSEFSSGWSWDFGDGNTDTTKNALHNYASDGYYEVCLVSNNAYCQDQICKVIYTQVSECGATFERGYGGANQEYCNDIQQLNDCGYIACGYTKSYGNQNYFDMYLLRMNAEGDTVWTRHYGVDNHEYTSSVLPTEDGGFLVFGHGTPEGSFDQDFILFKTNKFGDELWSKRYGGSGNETSQEMISVDNNSFLLMGSTTSYGPTSESIYVINVDSLGDTLWTKVISKTDYDLPESIISISDGGYLITGSGSFPRSIVLVKMDTNGDTVWTRNYGPSGCGDFGGSAVETNDNGFMVFFRPEGFSCGFSSIGILKVDSLGDSLWIKNYSRWETAVAVVPESDTTFLLTGYQINSATGAYNLYLMKINDNGDSLFSRFFAETSYSVGNSIRRTLDGGFVIAGSANNFSAGGYDSYFLKINSLYDSICNVKAAVIPDVLSICAGDSVRFDNNSYGSNSYQWLENNVAFSTDTNIVRQFNATGIYTISLIATDSVCIDTSNVDIQVTKAYVDLGADTSICKGEIVVLDAGSGFEYYLWSNAATSQSIGEDTLGDYYVLVIDSNGCTAKDTVIINKLFAKPIINLGNDTSFCLGNTINLEVDSLYVEYMWSNASTSQGIVADTLGNYFVMVTDSNGCTGEDTLEIINLFTNPVIDLGNDTSFCQGKTITLEVITLFDNYMWSDGSTSQSTTANSSGVYFLQILDTNNCMSSDTIIVNVANCDSVWPGDCNYNGKVHWNDLFLLGRYYGKQGLTRAITGSLWQAYDSDSWSDSTKRGVDLKHLDCDGSGKLNRKDATAVRDNYKKSHAKSPAHQNNPANPDLYFEILSGDIAPGTTVEIAIMLGRDTISALPVYGMGFEINVDKTMIQNNSLDIKFDQGIFSIDTNNISIVIGRDTISSTIIGAVTRTDTIDITGFGEIGRLKFTIDSNAVVGSSLGLQILNSGGVINIGDSTDYFHPPGEADTSITVNPPDGITESFSYSKFKLYPNPSDKSVSFDLPNDLLGSKYEFMNNIGQVVLSGNLTSKSVNVSRLQQGLYHVKVYSSKGIYYQKLEILR